LERAASLARKADRKIFQTVVTLRRNYYVAEDKKRQKNYMRHKQAVDARLDFLAKEIIAGEELLESFNSDLARIKIENRVHGLMEQRAEIVNKLPAAKRQEDLDSFLALRDENSRGEPSAAPVVPVHAQEVSLRSAYFPDPTVNEGPVSGEDATALGMRQMRIIMPVSGGAVSPPTDVIQRTHISYVEPGLDPALEPRWSSSRRDRIELIYPRTSGNRWTNFWRRIRGSDRYGPYIRSNPDDALWYDPTGDPGDKELFVLRKGTGKTALAALVVAGVITGWAAHSYLVPSPPSVTVAEVRANARQAIAEERPAIVRDVTAAVKPVVSEAVGSETRAAAQRLNAEVNNAAQAAASRAIADSKEIRTATVLNMQVKDLGADDVMLGRLADDDLAAKQLTGRADHSFVRGMADYLLMRHYQRDWGIAGEVSPYDPQAVAKLHTYRTSAATDQYYLAEVDALQNYIMLETLQRYPGRGSILHWTNVGGRDEVMMSHRAPDGTPIVPVLPNDRAVSDIVAKARTATLVR
jgi:hypothetical protein